MIAALLIAATWGSMGLVLGWTSDSSDVVFEAVDNATRETRSLVVDPNGRVLSTMRAQEAERWAGARKFSGNEIVSESALDGILQVEGGFTVAVRESAGGCPQVMLVVQRRKIATDAPPKGTASCTVQSDIHAQVSPDGTRMAVAWEVLRSGGIETQRGYYAIVRK